MKNYYVAYCFEFEWFDKVDNKWKVEENCDQQPFKCFKKDIEKTIREDVIKHYITDAIEYRNLKILNVEIMWSFYDKELRKKDEK